MKYIILLAKHHHHHHNDAAFSYALLSTNRAVAIKWPAQYGGAVIYYIICIWDHLEPVASHIYGLLCLPWKFYMLLCATWKYIDSQADNRWAHNKYMCQMSEAVRFAIFPELQSRPPNIHVIWHKTHSLTHTPQHRYGSNTHTLPKSYIYIFPEYLCRWMRRIHPSLRQPVDLFWDFGLWHFFFFAECLTRILYLLGHAWWFCFDSLLLCIIKHRFMLACVANSHTVFFKRQRHPKIWRVCTRKNGTYWRGADGNIWHITNSNLSTHISGHQNTDLSTTWSPTVILQWIYMLIWLPEDIRHRIANVLPIHTYIHMCILPYTEQQHSFWIYRPFNWLHNKSNACKRCLKRRLSWSRWDNMCNVLIDR